MRKKLLLLLSLLAAYAAPAQWTKLTTATYSGLDLTDIFAYKGNIIATGFTFSDFQGYLLRSTDDGKTWDTVQVPPKGYLFKTIAFKDPDTGFIGGYGSITVMLRTTDGGKNWSYYYQDTANAGINDMHFLNSQVGVASGYGHTQFYSGQCYRTYDGGASWQKIDSQGLGCLDTLPMDYVQFVDAQTGYGRADFLLARSIMKTTDSGKSWALQYTHAEGIIGIHFWNAGSGILVDTKGKVYTTSDGGQNWLPVASNLPVVSFGSMAFLNQVTGFIVGAGGKIYKTADGGKSWTKETSKTTADLMRVRFCENRAYVAGRGGVVLRSDELPNGVDKVLPLHEQLNVYPNPAASVLNVSSFNGVYKNIKATLADMNGRTVKYGATSGGLLQLPVAELPAGVYNLVLSVDGRNTSMQVSIER